MMPVRVGLNVAYALLVSDLDRDQREEFDGQLYGWTAKNEQANQTLRRAMMSGGED